MNEPTLTSDLSRRIVAGIRAGGFPQVAASAQYVNARLLERWLRLGRRKNAEEPYRSFACDVEAAQAQARLRAEMGVHEKDARTWLKHGPGRDLPGKPGWASLARPSPSSGGRGTELLSSPELLQLLGQMRGALVPFPEAMAAVTRLIGDADE
jgi:hypothetical protein